MESNRLFITFLFYFILATLTGYLLNLAIGLQVLLGALVTGLSAAVSPSRVSLFPTFCLLFLSIT